VRSGDATPGPAAAAAARPTVTATREKKEVAAPIFSAFGGLLSEAQQVEITTLTPGASVRYTIDGSDPTSTTGTPYSSPVTIAFTSTLKAIAYQDGWNDSAISTAVYYLPEILESWSSDGIAPPAAVAVDGDGHPNVAYASKVDGAWRMMFAASDGQVWNYIPLPSADYGVLQPLIEIFRGSPVVFYNSMMRGYTDTMLFDVERRKAEVVVTGFPLFGALAADDTTGIHYLAYNNSNGILNYTHGFPGKWSSANIEKIGPDLHEWFFQMSISTDSAGGVYACYYNLEQKALRYAFLNGSAWKIESIYPDTRPGTCAIRVDGNGTAHIAYGTSSNGLLYLQKDGSGWLKEVIHPDNSNGWCPHPNLEIDSNNLPYLLYNVNGKPVYARRDGAAWAAISCETCTADRMDFDLDSDNNAHILISDRTSGKLLYYFVRGENAFLDTKN
jgi:hypothetical protein